MVAEAMIFANEMVGQALAAAFPSRSLLRRHPAPAPSQFAGLSRVLGAMVRPVCREAGKTRDLF